MYGHHGLEQPAMIWHTQVHEFVQDHKILKSTRAKTQIIGEGEHPIC